ncbi:MAG: hypothetical protein BWY26_00478 [Elusimicrobia bacterium ADurb.Bin231]|nr:MAG: hypothetical protein BWY26_00478 [Elusimicrobia bacterium ADurb.Bin231]
MASKKILLHICCGVCAGYPVQYLREQGFEVTGYFYNPNIQPKNEYEKRFENTKKIADILKLPLITHEEKEDIWYKTTKGLENEKEGGKRCYACFKLRLAKTFITAEQENFDYFTTTLSVSPYKNSEIINDLGSFIGNQLFFPANFKKKDGFKKTSLMAENYGLYRQNYCGCLYSKKELK